MAGPFSSKQGPIFGPSSDEIAQHEQDVLQKSNSDQADAALADNGRYGNAHRAGYLAGTVAGVIGHALQGPSDQVKKAKTIEDGINSVDDSFQPDPSKSDLENEAAKLGQYQQSVGHLLSPDQKLALSAQRFAYLNDAFQQSRLKSADDRAERKLSADLQDSNLDLRINQEKLTQLQRTREKGVQANLGVFKMPDGSEANVGQGGTDFDALMAKADDPNSGVVFKGFRSELLQRDLQAQKTAAAAGKNYKVTDSQKKTYAGLSQIGLIMQNLETPLGQKGLSRFGGWSGAYDAMIDKYGQYLGVFGAPAQSESSFAATQMANLSVAQQQLIQGVPSDHDQYLIELTKPNRETTPPAVAISRLAFLKEDAINRTRAAYADFIENASPGQPVPHALAQAVNAFGIDPSTIGGAAEEQARLDAMAGRAADLSQQWGPYAADAQQRGTPRRPGDAGAPISLNSTSPVTLD